MKTYFSYTILEGDVMYPGNFSGLSFGKVIGGISKTLNLVNQAIPLYKQMRPLISNAGSILSIFREFNKPDVVKNSNEKSITMHDASLPIKTKIPSISTNSPTFFQ